MNDFTIKVGADNKEFVKAMKNADASVRNVASKTAWAFKAPDTAVANLTAKISSLTTLAKGAVVTAIGGFGIKSLTTDFMNLNANLANAVQLQGYNVEQLEATGRVMQRFGGNTQGAISSLDSLSSALQQARWGSGALVETAMKYGINYMKSNGQLMNAEELLQSLSKQLNKFDSQTKQAIASQLGLDNALLRVIDTGNYDSLIANQKKMYTATQKDLQVATQFESAMLDLRDSFQSVAKELSLAILPHLTSLMQWATGIIKRFKSVNIGALATFGAMATGIAGVVKGVSGLSTALGVLKGIAKGLFTPFNIIVGVFTLLFKIFEDLYVYNQGGKSVFGEMVKRFPALGKAFDVFKDLFGSIASGIEKVFDFFVNPSWDKFKDLLVSLKDTFVEMFSTVWKWITDLLEGPINSVLGVYESIKSGIKSGISSAGEWIGGAVDYVSSKFKKGPTPDKLQTAGSASAGQPVDASIKNQTNNITVVTSDPDKAARGVYKAIEYRSTIFTGNYAFSK